MKTPSKTKTYSKKKTHLKSVVFDCLFKARYKSIRFSREYSFFDATTHLVPCKFHAGKFLSQHFSRLLRPFSHHLFPDFLPNLFFKLLLNFFLDFLPTFLLGFFLDFFPDFFPLLITYIKSSFLS